MTFIRRSNDCCTTTRPAVSQRGLLTAAGEHFTVMRSDQISSRLDVAALKAFLGETWKRFELVGLAMKLPQLASMLSILSK